MYIQNSDSKFRQYKLRKKKTGKTKTSKTESIKNRQTPSNGKAVKTESSEKMVDEIPGTSKKGQGIVYRKSTGHYQVNIGESIVSCDLSPRLRKTLVYPIADPNSRPAVVDYVKDIDTVDPVAVGDQVEFVDNQDGTGLIVEVLPRRSKLSRLNPGKKKIEQVVVANLDQVVPVFAAAQPEPKWNLLDRYLVSAESCDLPSLIVITKMDLLEDEDPLMVEVENYRAAGYRVILTSTVTGEGIQELQEALRDNVSVFVGKSGVGKTSLLNAIQPELGLKVNEVSQATGKGRHTTTQLAMFVLEYGGSVVDTPGMREFGIWDARKRNSRELDLALFFPEMRSLVGRCKFGLDCSHDHEPGCAIQEAVEKNNIPSRRYESYLRLQEGG
jgi:ribosome biogenesis GTPase / thiamine phosphate phosphatase